MVAMDGQSHLMLRSGVRQFNELKALLVSTRRSTLCSKIVRIEWIAAFNKEMKFNSSPTHSVC